MRDIDYAIEILTQEMKKQTSVVLGNPFNREDEMSQLNNINLLASAILKIKEMAGDKEWN